jgi:hypothetical protein
MYVAIMSQQAARMARAAQEGSGQALEYFIWCAARLGAHVRAFVSAARAEQAARARLLRGYDVLYPLLIMIVAILVILEVACRRFWFFAMLEHKIFLNFAPYEHRVWHYRFWTKPAFGYLPHVVLLSTIILALTSRGMSYTLTVCTIQAISLLMFLSSSIQINDVMCMHEWAERFCVKNTAVLREQLRAARVSERAALKIEVRTGVGAEAAAAATAARKELSLKLTAAVQQGFHEAVDVISQLTVVDEVHFVSDLHYVRKQRALAKRTAAEALAAATKGKPYAERAALAKQSREELKHLLAEKWHYRLFDEVDDATGEVLPCLGKMHCVPQPTKAATKPGELINYYTNVYMSFGFHARAWAHHAAMEADAFLDSHKHRTLTAFNTLGALAALLTVVVEVYGFYVMGRTVDNPKAAQCEATVVSACTVAACLKQTCTLRNGYIPAPV